jgi:hypothetical protein
MIQMSAWFYWLSILLPLAVGCFVAFWLGVDKGLKQRQARYDRLVADKNSRILELRLTIEQKDRDLAHVRLELAAYQDSPWSNYPVSKSRD